MKNDSKVFSLVALMLILGAGIAIYFIYFRAPAAPELKRDAVEPPPSIASDKPRVANPRDFAPEAAGRTDPVVSQKPEQPVNLDKAVRRMLVMGRIVDETGAALHDTRVEFQGTGELALFKGTGYTDPQGQYALLAWERSNIRKANSGETGGFVHARTADGRLGVCEISKFALAPTVNMPDVVLKAQSGIEGEVREEGGGQAPFCQVTLRSMGMLRVLDDSGGAYTYEHRPVSRTAIADERGRFRFMDLPPGKYGLTVESCYYGAANAITECDLSAGGLKWQEVKLQRQNYVRGVLRDQDGTAIEGAVVLLKQAGELRTPGGDIVNTDGDDMRAKISPKREGERGRDFRANKTRWRTITDAEGRFGFAGLHDVEHELSAQLGAKVAEVKNVRVNAGDFFLILELESSIAGVVRDAATNMPVNRYDIRLVGSATEPTPFDRVKEDALFPWHSEGRFRVLNAPAGGVLLRVSAPGYAPALVSVKDLIKGERRTGIDVALKPLCDVVLTLKLGERLLPREPVLLLYDGRSIAEGASDEFGELRLTGIMPADYELTVQRADGSVLKCRLSVPAKREERLTVNMESK